MEKPHLDSKIPERPLPQPKLIPGLIPIRPISPSGQTNIVNCRDCGHPTRTSREGRCVLCTVRSP